MTDEIAGIFKASITSPAFKNNSSLKIDQLPPVDDSDVKEVLVKQQTMIDSLKRIELAKKEKNLRELNDKLIKIYIENDPIIIYDIMWLSNSVGGIEVDLKVINCSLQTIKYITFSGYFLNAVGDKCRNEIGGGTIWTGKGVGPIGPRPTSLDNDERLNSCEGSYNFDNLTFYSRIADSFKLSTVIIQYMNGKTITLSGANLEKHVRYKYPK